ncbi:2-hydroxychromene-2-carboxylate isomerase [Amycolatopsis minnesotensis]|uniref:2-hydroxychromene-2-carboxylate isomerase n=1 Tax=Amycolatopsis minnesotensis TaxID=337894 RepID=A0ABP5BCH9_9PSEU
MAKSVKARWYFSLRSPYSWLCYRDLLATDPGVLDVIEWVPAWEPGERLRGQLVERGVEMPWMPMSRAKHFYILQDVRRLSKDRDLPMTWPIDNAPNWDVAHVGYLAAARAGAARAYVDRVYAARWERGENISDPAVIGAVGQEIGLGAELVSRAHEDEELLAQGLDVLEEVARDGLFGVPLFTVGREKFWGVDRLDRFVSTLRARVPMPDPSPTAAEYERMEFPELAHAVSDAGHAGGCG